MNELIGLCRGILADGTLVYSEVLFLYDWLRRNDPVRSTVFGKKLFAETQTVVKAKELASREEALVALIYDLIGGTPDDGSSASRSSRIPLDDPPPPIVFPGRTFCLTGKFHYGSRSTCNEAVISRGGTIHPTVHTDTNFLVVGDIGSRDWAHSTHGRKIERALELQWASRPIAIVHEEHWLECLQAAAPG
jgi:NAD-dependent DNA ligase